MDSRSAKPEEEARKGLFIIKRKDRDTSSDDVVLESTGLTIGRLVGNDLPLNHRAVSRTHAGVKEIKGEFWLFNLSQSNGTVLNGELVDRTPLADGDVIQIGPYLLRINVTQKALTITVERELEVHPVGGATSLLSVPQTDMGEEGIATVQIRIPSLPKPPSVVQGGTQRLKGTGLLASILPAQDEQALELFWKERKREAGKVGGQTPLHPRGGQKVGKAQFNWRPTLDLRKLWRKSYFIWGALVTALASVVAVIAYEHAYSPGPISTAHSSASLPTGRAIALQANSSSCSNCHGVTTGMQDKCISCHDLATSPPPSRPPYTTRTAAKTSPARPVTQSTRARTFARGLSATACARTATTRLTRSRQASGLATSWASRTAALSDTPWRMASGYGRGFQPRGGGRKTCPNRGPGTRPTSSST
jgi:pSer/pThr/pTyr-binding forkhead associated (FHA) protein